MIQSMTAFASHSDACDGARWDWDIRSGNGRGLDLRVRVPDGLDGLEQAVRAQVATALSRGTVTITLRLLQDDPAAAVQIDTAQLDRVLHAMAAVQRRADDLGVALAPSCAGDVLAQRGVLVAGQADADMPRLVPALVKDFGVLLGDFVTMRAREGAVLLDVITGHLAQIAALTEQAADAAAARAQTQKAAMTSALQRVMIDAIAVDPARVAQELAQIAIKSDVTEEIDRLRAHVTAAQALLAQSGPTGRKLDFLMQEFNREANTLCAKSQSTPLTAIGLDLKAVIEQMREQIQNVE